ncbi:J domain-containing protein [Aphelenchoides fujianensis]|nr:J domain-containing protein [Aphelenchoides fujianensis]
MNAEQVAVEQPARGAVDHYAVLGVQRTATGDEIQAAFRQLSRRHHPDRNGGSEESNRVFARISAAYAVLSDPRRREQYDNLEGQVQAIGDGLELSGSGVFGRALFWGVNHLQGVKTAIPPGVLHEAEEIAVSNEWWNAHPHVQPLGPNAPFSGSVRRATAKFFCIEMREEFQERGVWIHCRSDRKDRLKLVLFGQDGAVAARSDAHNTQQHSIAELFFVPQELQLHAAAHYPGVKNELFGVEGKLIDLQASIQHQPADSLATRRHLLAVCGDNFFRASRFELTFIPLGGQHAVEMQALVQAGDRMADAKTRLAPLGREFGELGTIQQRTAEQQQRRTELEAELTVRVGEAEQLVQEFDVEHARFFEFCRSNPFAPPPAE